MQASADEASAHSSGRSASASSRRRRSCAVTFCPRPTIACSAASTKPAAPRLRRAAGLRRARWRGRSAPIEALIAAMKHGEPRLDFTVAAEAVAATGHRQSPPARDRLRQRLLFGSIRHAASRRRPLHRHRLFRSDDRPRPRTLSVDRLRGRRCDQAALPRRCLRHRLQRRVADAHHRLSSRDPRSRARRGATASSTACRCSTITGPPICSKYAYGAPVVEIVFGKQELMSLCRDAGLRLVREWPGIPYDVLEVTGHHSSAATYLFAR